MSEKKAAEKVDAKSVAKMTGHKVKLIKIADDPSGASNGGNVKKVLFSTHKDASGNNPAEDGHGYFFVNTVPSGGTTKTSNPNLEKLIVAYANGTTVDYDVAPTFFTRAHGEVFTSTPPPTNVFLPVTDSQHFLLSGDIT